MSLKEAMKEAKRTGKRQKVTNVVHGGETKVTISLRIDYEVLEKIKVRAEELGLGYQTLINSALTQFVRGEGVKDLLADAIKRLEAQNKRLSDLEKLTESAMQMLDQKQDKSA